MRLPNPVVLRLRPKHIRDSLILDSLSFLVSSDAFFLDDSLILLRIVLRNTSFSLFSELV